MDSITKILQELASTQPHIPALIGRHHVVDFYDLLTLSNAASSLLFQKGIKPNQHVALVFDEPVLNIIFALACLRCGFCQISQDSSESKHLRESVYSRCDIDWILSDNTNCLKELKHSILCTFETLNNTQIITSPFPETDLNTLAFLNIGSGSTGKSKIIQYTFSQANDLLFNQGNPLKLKKTERFLSLIPSTFHAGKYRNLSNLFLGLSCVLINNAPATTLIDRLKIDHLYCSDAHIDPLIQSRGNSQPLRFPKLKSLIVVGSPMSAERVKQIRNTLTKNMFIIYGTNEVGIISLADPATLQKHPDSIGKVLPGARIELFNLENNVGHIKAKTKGMVTGYYKNPSATAENFQDGWFIPKDLIEQNPEGFLFFKGRSDDLIIYDGMNIFPIEIEQHFDALPEIEECAAFPMSYQGKIVPAVAIVPASPPDKLDTSKLQTRLTQYIESKMGKRSPVVMFLLGELPRNARGKILRYQLREQLETRMS